MKHKYDHGCTPSLYLKSSVREENLFLYPLRFGNWDMQIKLTKDRLTGEKTNFIHICTLQKMCLREVIRIWSSYRLEEKGRERKGTCGKRNDFWER